MFLPGREEPLPSYGVPARRRPDEPTHQEGHTILGRGTLLHRGNTAGAGLRPQAALHPQRSQARQHTDRQERTHQAVRLRFVQAYRNAAEETQRTRGQKALINAEQQQKEDGRGSP